MAIGPRAGDFRRADHAAAAAAILHDDGAEHGPHPISPHAPDHIGRAAGRERNDQPDRPLDLGRRRPRQRRRRKAAKAELEQVTALHDVSHSRTLATRRRYYTWWTV